MANHGTTGIPSRQNEPEGTPRCAGSSGPVEVCGALHLHTTCSDGRVPYPQFIETARALGLDFIGMTDHMTLRGRTEGFEGFHGRMFVLVGYEHNDADNKNHYLAFGAKKVSKRDKPQDYIDDIRGGGGVGFLAHPCERRHYFKSLPPYPWTDWSVKGYDGFEIWNQMSDWTERIRTVFSLVKFMYPRRYLYGTTPDLLRRWDALNRTRFVAGIGGVDAHSHLIPLGPLRMTVFPLKVELQGVRTHLYLPSVLPQDDSETAARMLCDAMRSGRGFVSNYRWGNARSSTFRMQHADGSVCLPGMQPVPHPLPATLRVELPLPARILLFRNGALIGSCSGKTGSFRIEGNGVYRVEARRKNRAWIYTNPFPVGEYPL